VAGARPFMRDTGGRVSLVLQIRVEDFFLHMAASTSCQARLSEGRRAPEQRCAAAASWRRATWCVLAFSASGSGSACRAGCSAGCSSGLWRLLASCCGSSYAFSSLTEKTGVSVGGCGAGGLTGGAAEGTVLECEALLSPIRRICTRPPSTRKCLAFTVTSGRERRRGRRARRPSRRSDRARSR
jgi:hypothetical protein